MTSLRVCYSATGSCACMRRSEQHSRSEEHTSELQSRQYLVCRLLLEKKKNKRLVTMCVTTRRLQMESAPGSCAPSITDCTRFRQNTPCSTSISPANKITSSVDRSSSQ